MISQFTPFNRIDTYYLPGNRFFRIQPGWNDSYFMGNCSDFDCFSNLSEENEFCENLNAGF